MYSAVRTKNSRFVGSTKVVYFCRHFLRHVLNERARLLIINSHNISRRPRTIYYRKAKRVVSSYTINENNANADGKNVPLDVPMVVISYTVSSFRRSRKGRNP